MLGCLSIRGNLLDWLLSIMQQHMLRVRVNEKMSELYSDSMGVAQGSVLVPLIFLLFINDLLDFVNDGLVVNFADDTPIAVTSELERWCSSNKLILNKEKTVTLYFNEALNL